MTLSVSPANPRYFRDGSGNIVYLAGWYDNFSPQAGGDWPLVLSTIQTHGLNLCRLWVRHHEGGSGQYTPYSFTKSGATYDLAAPNPTYLTALRSACTDLATRNAYALVMLWQGWSLTDNGYGNPFLTCPFKSTLNINSVNGDWYNGNGYGLEVDEARTHTATSLAGANASELAIRTYQRIWIRAVIDKLNDLDNVIWEVSNEDRFTAQNQVWHEWVANEIRTYEETKAKQHPVLMSSTYDGTTSVNPWLKSTSADAIAPNDAAGGYSTSPEVNDFSKVCINDVDHIGLGYGGTNPNVSADWAWKTALRGHQPLQIYPRYEDANFLTSLGKTIAYLNGLTLASVVPTSDTGICSTGYCQYWHGREYLFYQPGSGVFSASIPEGYYNYEWFNPATGLVTEANNPNDPWKCPGGTTQHQANFSGPSVMLVRRVKKDSSYGSGNFSWSYTHGEGSLPTEYRIKYGTVPGSYSSYATAPYGDTQKAVSAVIPSPGVYFAKLYAYNSVNGEFASATEIYFESQTSLSGNINVVIL